MRIDGKLYRVTLPYAVFGIIVNDQNIVMMTAPIGKWMRGKHLIRDIAPWIISKRGSVELNEKEI